MDESSFSLLRWLFEFIKEEYNVHQAIKNKVRAIQVRHSSVEDDKNALKKANITQATEVTPLKTQRAENLID